MTLSEVTTHSSGNIGLLDRAIRAGLGLAVLIAAIHASVEGVEAYPFVKMFAAFLVLTAIAGWDPLYAAFRTSMKRLTPREYVTRSSGNIGLQDRAIRIGTGLVILFATLHFSIDGYDAYPVVKLIATLMVLTGIAGWDPAYAAFRSMIERIKSRKDDDHNQLYSHI